MKGWAKLGYVLLMVIMIISTTSTAIASQEAARAAKNTDLIAQCTTPGTKCYDLQIVQEARRTAQNKCIIDSILNLPPVQDRAARRKEILDNYDKCVIDETKVSVATTSTTILVPKPTNG